MFPFWCLLALLPLLAVTASASASADPTAPAPPSLDVWVLAGQSNMQGAGVLRGKDRVDTRVKVFGMDNRWDVAREPIHRIFEAEAEAYYETLLLIWQGLTREQYEQIRRESKTVKPWGDVGPGAPFGRHLAKALNKPVGLIPCALGATSLANWDWRKKDEGTRSLYGATLDRIRKAGGTLRGVLWYQGEGDAGDAAQAATYGERFAEWVDAIRRDTGIPDLPVIAVQIGRFCSEQPEPLHRGWEVMRDTQRTMTTLRPNLWVVSAADLELDDLIHVGYDGQQRLGKRLAEVALAKVYHKGRCQGPIDLESVQRLEPERGADVLRVRFKGVTGKLRSAGRPTGFAIRSETPGPHVFQVKLDPTDPHAVIVRVFPRMEQPCSLIYGVGLDPCLNLTDELDMPVPAFGPVAIP